MIRDGRNPHGVRNEYLEYYSNRSRTKKLQLLQQAFPDRSFDLVYSNAVIEHVGEWADQRLMAAEVMRVGRSWFIATPNRWFPFESHARMPFIGWLPHKMMQRSARVLSYDHAARRYRSGVIKNIRLLTGGEMKLSFPGTLIVRLRTTFWP